MRSLYICVNNCVSCVTRGGLWCPGSTDICWESFSPSRSSWEGKRQWRTGWKVVDEKWLLPPRVSCYSNCPAKLPSLPLACLYQSDVCSTPRCCCCAQISSLSKSAKSLSSIPILPNLAHFPK